MHRWALVAKKTKNYTDVWNAGNYATSATSGSPEYTVSTGNAIVDAWKAFDGVVDGTSNWAPSNESFYISLDLGSNSSNHREFSGIKFYMDNGVPTTFTYAISDNGSSWTDVLSVGGQNTTAAMMGITSYPANSSVIELPSVGRPYRYHRISVSAADGTVWFILRVPRSTVLWGSI
jgi:hypothetical protein